MHPVIWKEHDDSWTWSIEEGKAFEDGHAVLARQDGFPTRGDAKEDMQKAWARLISEGKEPSRIGKVPGKTAVSKPAAKDAAAKKPSAKTAAADGFDPTLPEWAVIADARVVALFADKKAAQRYAKAEGAKTHSVRRVRAGLQPGD